MSHEGFQRIDVDLSQCATCREPVTDPSSHYCPGRINGGRAGGFTCKDCNRLIPPGATHRPLPMTKQCRTVTEIGVECLHDWAQEDSLAAVHGSHKIHGSHFETQHVGRRHVKPLVPHRHSRSVLENAARELAGVNGHLESYRHHEDEEYVTIELIVRKDRV